MPSKKSQRRTRQNDWRQRDPEYQAEAEKYGTPLPSRQLILETLDKTGPLRMDALAEELRLSAEDSAEGFRRRLGAMVRDGQLLKNRRGAFGRAERMNLVAGRVSAHRDGFGFLTPDEGGADIFMPPREMESLMSGDRVMVQPSSGDRFGKREGRVVEVLERANKTVAGRLVDEHGVLMVVPANPRIIKDVLIPPQDAGKAKAGQMVVAEIVTPPARRSLPVGRIVEVMGDHLAPGMEIETAVRAFGLPHLWPEKVEKAIKGLPKRVLPKQKEGRFDLRELPLVTIDGEDARDFDDAVHCRRTPRGFQLFVAIADVAAYVERDSALDQEAALRGNSAYFPSQVIPMLPEVLSNGLCSLNPKVDRLAMVCEMRVNLEGEVTRAKFYEGVIRSHARLTYEQVAEALAEPEGSRAKRMKRLLPHLQDLELVFEALLEARGARGAIDFESTETRMIFGEDRKIEKIVPVQRNKAHRMIEECMIAANVQAAKFVLKKKLPTLYRVHERPTGEKVTALREFLATRGMSLGGGAEPQARDFAKVSEAASKRDDAAVVQMAILRTLMQARYSPMPDGHFGLALEHYGHFTSPIRRYPDLLLHRALKHAIHKRPLKKFAYSDEQMQSIGDHCSMTERRADEASRDVTNWLKCEYMQQFLGQSFDGVIAGVAGFGVFVQLKDLHVEGMVHVSALYSDYYEFDAQHQRLVGTRNGRTFQMGDPLRVRVTRVSLDERKIDLEPDEAAGEAAGKVGDGSKRKQVQAGFSGKSAKSKQSGRAASPTGKNKQRRGPGSNSKAAKSPGSGSKSPKRQSKRKKK